MRKIFLPARVWKSRMFRFWLQRDSDCSLLKAGEERRVTKDWGGDVQLVSRWDRLIEGERGGEHFLTVDSLLQGMF